MEIIQDSSTICIQIDFRYHNLKEKYNLYYYVFRKKKLIDKKIIFFI